MAQVEVLFTNGKIVTAGKIIEGFVAVDKEKIVAVGEGDTAPQALKTIDLKGRTLWHHDLGLHAAERQHGTALQGGKDRRGSAALCRRIRAVQRVGRSALHGRFFSHAE